MIPPGLELGTLLMLGACDDHYTTESTAIAQPPSLLSLIITENEQGKKISRQHTALHSKQLCNTCFGLSLLVWRLFYKYIR